VYKLHFMAALRSRCRHYTFVLFFFFFLSSFFPRLISAVADRMFTILPYMMWLISANLGCRSETCFTRLEENTGRKNDAKNRHVGTTAQICRAISTHLRHVSTIEKNLLNSNTFSSCLRNMANIGRLAAEIVSLVWGTPANFNGFRVLASLLHGTLVVGVSQTLRR